MNNGLVYLWTGNGAGKTTSALGVALRAVGHGKKVIVIQFLKGQKNIGEYKIMEKLAPFYEIYQFGGEEFVDPKNLKPEDYEKAQKGLEFAKECLKKKPFLLILDELNLIAAGNLISKEKILGLLNGAPKETTIYITGRYAPQWLVDRADFATEIKEIKHPIQKGFIAKEGIEY